MKRLLTILVSVVMLVVLGGVVLGMTAPTAANPADAETLARANQLYGNGQYAAASALYEQLVAGGINNSAVYYNLGNTQMQTGQYGAAVESYVAAQALAPRDADIANNLALARQQAGLTVPDTAVRTAIGTFSRDELATAALLLWSVIAVIILALRRRFAPGVVKPLLAVLVFGLVVTGALFLGQVALENRVVEVEAAAETMIEDAAQAADAGGLDDVLSN